MYVHVQPKSPQIVYSVIWSITQYWRFDSFNAVCQ